MSASVYLRELIFRVPEINPTVCPRNYRPLHGRSLPNLLCILPGVRGSFSGSGVAVSYPKLPVLWTTTCLNVMLGSMSIDTAAASVVIASSCAGWSQTPLLRRIGCVSLCHVLDDGGIHRACAGDEVCCATFFSVGGVNWTIAVNMSRLTENLENRTPVGLQNSWAYAVIRDVDDVLAQTKSLSASFSVTAVQHTL